jgi:hypothetical protein
LASSTFTSGALSSLGSSALASLGSSAFLAFTTFASLTSLASFFSSSNLLFQCSESIDITKSC